MLSQRGAAADVILEGGAGAGLVMNSVDAESEHAGSSSRAGSDVSREKASKRIGIEQTYVDVDALATGSARASLHFNQSRRTLRCAWSVSCTGKSRGRTDPSSSGPKTAACAATAAWSSW
jgi:hypothetical protein